MQQTSPGVTACAPVLVGVSAVLAAGLLGACAPAENMLAGAVGVPGTATHTGTPDSLGMPLAGSGPTHPAGLAVTPEQQAYLDALAAAGVHPSSEVTALSIGSFICQAKVAGQSEAAVRDFVLPMVRGDVHDALSEAHPARAAVTSAEVDGVTAAYLRIATDRLC